MAQSARSRCTSKRRRGRLLAASAVTALTATAAAGCASSTAATTGSNGSPGMVLINTSQYDGNIITPVVKPSGTLTADNGTSFNVQTDTKGNVTLLYFGYTHCPDLCPLTMSNTSVALRMLPKADQAKIRVLFVSVDPGRTRLRGCAPGSAASTRPSSGCAARYRRSRSSSGRPACRSARPTKTQRAISSLITRPKCSRTVPTTWRTKHSSRPRRPPRWRTT